MKIDITYEKDDILRLVLEDLKRRQIKVRAGFKPEYKGALHVKLSIEADDEDEAAPPPPKTKVEATPGGDGETPPPEVDMDEVLNQSRRVEATTKPSFKAHENGEQPLRRQLGPNESLEFPKE